MPSRISVGDGNEKIEITSIARYFVPFSSGSYPLLQDRDTWHFAGAGPLSTGRNLFTGNRPCHIKIRLRGRHYRLAFSNS
jgi:hypothetical protein